MFFTKGLAQQEICTTIFLPFSNINTLLSHPSFPACSNFGSSWQVNKIWFHLQTNWIIHVSLLTTHYSDQGDDWLCSLCLLSNLLSLYEETERRKMMCSQSRTMDRTQQISVLCSSKCPTGSQTLFVKHWSSQASGFQKGLRSAWLGLSADHTVFTIAS